MNTLPIAIETAGGGAAAEAAAGCGAAGGGDVDDGASADGGGDVNDGASADGGGADATSMSFKALLAGYNATINAATFGTRISGPLQRLYPDSDKRQKALDADVASPDLVKLLKLVYIQLMHEVADIYSAAKSNTAISFSELQIRYCSVVNGGEFGAQLSDPLQLLYPGDAEQKKVLDAAEASPELQELMHTTCVGMYKVY
jgi:hypothetical protein